MNINDITTNALDAFIVPFRQYIATLLKKHVGEEWADAYAYTLSERQQQFWYEGIEKGRSPVDLIDWSHLKVFSMKYKNALRDDFGRKVNSLPTWLEEIVEVRNAWAHNDTLDDDDGDEVDRAMGNMVRIFQILDMKDSEKEIRELRKLLKPVSAVPETTQLKMLEPSLPLNLDLIPWFRNVRPHEDIKSGNLDESVFAANLAEVKLGAGQSIYKDPDKFFEKTYFTAGLKNLAKRVVHGLNGDGDAENRVISLQTGFGGGKTHSLISLYHLANAGKFITDCVYVDELIEVSGEPKFRTPYQKFEFVCNSQK